MEDIRPTAKWANRMLRPLKSIYHRLEKHQGYLSPTTNTKLKESSEGSDAEHTRLSKLAGTEERCLYSDDEPDDPVWVPGRLGKRRIKNYSSRGQRSGGRRRSRLLIRSPELRKTLPGAIDIATPLITGKARESLELSASFKKQLFTADLSTTGNSGATSQRKTSRTNNSSFPAYKGSWKETLDMSGDVGLADIAQLLDRVLMKFLHNTRVNITQQRDRGARSLMSMVARRLPEFIEDEQRIQDEAGKDCEEDMCDAYFTELEAHYAPGGCGWQPLREAVRAQGIHLVSEMIKKEWVPRPVACRLIQECLRHDEFETFEMLLSKCLTTVSTYDYPIAFDPDRPSNPYDDPIYILSTYYSRSMGRRAFVFDELAKLLLRRAMPPEWIVTTLWKKCVDGAIKSLSTEDGDSFAATRLIDAVILSASSVHPAAYENGMDARRPVRSRDTRASTMSTVGPPKVQLPCPIPIQDALTNLTASLVAALCGMHIARSDAPVVEERVTSMKVRNIVRWLALKIERDIQMKPLECGNDASTLQSLRCGYVLLANSMLQCGEISSCEVITRSESVSRQNIESFFISLALQQDIVKQLAALVQQVFRRFGPAPHNKKARTPEEIRNKVAQLAQLTNAPGISLFLNKVAAETAMGLAETTLDPNDHVWAVEIQESIVSSQQGSTANQHIAHGPARPDETTGLYEWEESIGEWVASTPASKFQAGYLDMDSKHVAGRPSTIACSTSSISPTAPSEDDASSVTSFAPSISTKRTFLAEDLAPRSSKRLRFTPAELNADQANDLADIAICKDSSTACPTLRTTRSRAGRGVLRELGQARNVLNQVIDKQARLERSTPKIEVVIIKKKSRLVSDKMAGEDLRSFSGRCTRSADESWLPTRSKPKPLQRPPPISLTPVSRTRTVIPCSDNDSDDELSFL